jgi:hypothetical protein
MKNASACELAVLAAGLAFGAGCGPGSLPTDEVADLPDGGAAATIVECCRREEAASGLRQCVAAGLRGDGLCAHLQQYYADASASGR